MTKKTEKPPRFLHMQSRGVSLTREFVVHTRYPAWLAEVFKFDTQPEAIAFEGECIQNEINIGGRTYHDGKTYVLAVIAEFEQYQGTTQKDANKLARIARRMADWYLYVVLKNEPFNDTDE